MTSWQATMLQQSNIGLELMTTTAMTICNVNVREKRMRAFNQYINYLIPYWATQQRTHLGVVSILCKYGINIKCAYVEQNKMKRSKNRNQAKKVSN